MSPRTARRVAWSIWAVTLLIPVGHLLGSFLAPGTLAAPRGIDAVFGILLLAFATVGALVASRRPDNAVGWVFAAFGLALAVATALEAYAVAALGGTAGASLAGAVAALLAALVGNAGTFVTLAAVLLLFPDGLLPSRRWRPVAWLAAASITGLSVFWLLKPEAALAAFPEVRNPLGVGALGGPAGAVLETLLFVLVLGSLLAGAGAQLVRFRRSSGIERQQLKWFASAGVVVGLAFLAGPLLWRPAVPELAWQLVFVAAVSTIPVAVGVAMLRYRLYEIDRIISRTLGYGLLTAVLAGVYLLTVVALQQLLRPLTGESQIAVAGATLAVAALFGPMRRRVQEAVDRRFNRSRYDAQRTVSAFRARLRDEVDLDQLGTELVTAVSTTVQPAEVRLWLRPTGAGRGSTSS